IPAAGQAVTVRAQVHDPDGLASLVLKYRVDPGTNVTVLIMGYRGAGIYSATIPAQSAGALVAFHIQAADNASPPVATTFPNDAPTQECLVRFGETIPNTGRIGTYRFWITQATNNRWTSRERNSNEPLDATFVYGNSRVVYNIGTLYSGSPWHTPGYNGPLNNICDYVLIFPDDDPLLGTTDFVMASLGKLYNVDATLEDFTTTGGAKKLARYRWNWRKRAVNDSANDYANLFSLVDAVNSPQPDPYFSRTDALVDVEEWARVFAVEHIVGN